MNDRERFLASSGLDKEMLAKVFDKAALALKRDIPAFTRFLSEREFAEVLSRKKYIDSVPFTAFGGYQGAGRVMLGFSQNEEAFPIKAVKITGKGLDKLSHPDFLGSIMSLGFDRNLVGDIVRLEDCSVLFCEDGIAGFIVQNLTFVGGCAVNCEICETNDISVTPKFETVTGTVASLRADSVVSVWLKTSRSKAGEYIEGQKFFLNQLLCTKCDKLIEENDVLSVRHHGKARLAEISGKSKKGRIFITIQKYI